ncbi:hypothetical protein TKK_0011112 [Trichogramma kaykai]|uniref:Uncharacterized protein n=1 Tax=Trichogramma kaykai TaxID=54128 RepID=A0ABD2WTV2_9HYME
MKINDCDNDYSSKPVRVQEGWNCSWQESESRQAVREVVRGPFQRPRVVKFSPYVVLSSCKSCTRSVELARCRRATERNGIPDPWLEYLAARDKKHGGDDDRARLQKRDARYTQLLWKRIGFSFAQGIPDPWRGETLHRCENTGYNGKAREDKAVSCCLTIEFSGPDDDKSPKAAAVAATESKPPNDWKFRNNDNYQEKKISRNQSINTEFGEMRDSRDDSLKSVARSPIDSDDEVVEKKQRNSSKVSFFESEAERLSRVSATRPSEPKKMSVMSTIEERYSSSSEVQRSSRPSQLKKISIASTEEKRNSSTSRGYDAHTSPRRSNEVQRPSRASEPKKMSISSLEKKRNSSASRRGDDDVDTYLSRRSEVQRPSQASPTMSEPKKTSIASTTSEKRNSSASRRCDASTCPRRRLTLQLADGQEDELKKCLRQIDRRISITQQALKSPVFTDKKIQTPISTPAEQRRKKSSLMASVNDDDDDESSPRVSGAKIIDPKRRSAKLSSWQRQSAGDDSVRVDANYDSSLLFVQPARRRCPVMEESLFVESSTGDREPLIVESLSD